MSDIKENINFDKRLFNDANIELNSHIIPEDADGYFIIIKDQIEKFISAGQYKWVLKALNVLESETAKKQSSDLADNIFQYYHSLQFFSLLINSFRIMGREKREEVLLLCDYFDEKIIPPLMDALIEEDSHSIRRFIISLITHFGDRAIPEAIKRLNDSKWFVKRNMLYILCECGKVDILLKARPYCDHGHPKVSFEAVKCLLKAKDNYAVEILQRYLRSKSRDVVTRAISLSGAFRVNEVVPELIQLLKKNTISGKDLNDKLLIVRALCQIGDPDVLEMLKGVLSSNTRLFKGSFEKLRKEIYGVVKNCSYKEAKDLLSYCENPESSVRRTKEEKSLARLRKKLALETFGEYRRKKTWLYISVLIVIAVISVVTWFTLSRNDKKAFQGNIPVIKETKNDTQRINENNKYIKDFSATHRIEKKITLSSNAALEEIKLIKKTEPRKVNNLYEKSIPNVSQKIYTIQIGSFTKIEYAQEQFDVIIDVLNEEELDFLRIERVGAFYSVRLGNFKDYEIAAKFLQINQPHLSTAIILNAYIKDSRFIKLIKYQSL